MPSAWHPVSPMCSTAGMFRMLRKGLRHIFEYHGDVQYHGGEASFEVVLGEVRWKASFNFVGDVDC